MNQVNQVNQVNQMNHNRFEHSLLSISLRSPFARRVRVAFLEHHVSFQEKVHDVFRPTPDFFEINPLGRVPALQLSDGQILIDSQLILQFFYEQIASDFIPTQIEEKMKMYYWSALSVGIMEKTVEYFIETQKPCEKQDEEIELELKQILQRILPQAEAQLAQNMSQGIYTLLSSGLTQADFDLGIALTYLELRFPQGHRLEAFPCLKNFYFRLSERESFQKTKPLAVV